MAKPFKFRYVNEIVGTFVLMAAGLLVAGIYVAGHAQGWFEDKLLLVARFQTEEGTFGLQEGAEIRILGTLAGRVGEITPAEGGGMQTTLIIKERFNRFVRQDSVAKVKKKFAVAGDSFIEITLGDPRLPVMGDGDEIRCEQDVEIIEAARKMLEDVRAEVLPVLEEVREILQNVNDITAEALQGSGTVAKFLRDPELANHLAGVMRHVEDTSSRFPEVADETKRILDQVEATAHSVRLSAAQFPAIATQASDILGDIRQVTGALTGQVAGVQGVLLQTQQTLREAENMLRAVQRHWLLRRYAVEGETSELLSPARLAPPASGGAL